MRHNRGAIIQTLVCVFNGYNNSKLQINQILLGAVRVCSSLTDSLHQWTTQIDHIIKLVIHLTNEKPMILAHQITVLYCDALNILMYSC